MLVFLGVLFTIILAGLDNTIVSTVMPVALPELGGARLYAWTFAAYMLAAAVSMPIWGPGSDRWGRRRTYLIGIVAFTVGSALCAIARTMMEFIGARAIQGIGAGAIATLPFVLLGVVYPPNKRGRALGAASSAWASADVVVLPFVPVTPIVGAGHSRSTRSASDTIAGAPSSPAARASRTAASAARRRGSVVG